MQSNGSSLQIIYNMHVMLLLVNRAFHGVSCISYLNLQWYHNSIILPANSIITHLQHLWIGYYNIILLILA